ncbi:MAG: hypothetical protein WA889_05350 [Xanthobacteraceae bacterium]
MNQSAPTSVAASREAFCRNRQKVTNAEWPKDNHECTPTQTGSVIRCALEAVAVECRSPRAEQRSKRAKKL